jgi:hypothetical protein
MIERTLLIISSIWIGWLVHGEYYAIASMMFCMHITYRDV